jgi:hypothetical protein
VLQDADATLRAVLLEGLPKGTALAFATPDQAWRTGIGTGPAVNAYLVQLREDVNSRSAHWTTVYDNEDRALARQDPIRRIRVHYVLTAWAANAEEEHALLGVVLRTLMTGATVPARCLTGSLAGLGDLVTLDVAHPDLAIFPLEAWSALGIPPRAGLDVVLTVPLVPATDRDLARRPDTVDLGVGSRLPGRATPRQPGRPHRRITEGR